MTELSRARRARPPKYPGIHGHATVPGPGRPAAPVRQHALGGGLHAVHVSRVGHVEQSPGQRGRVTGREDAAVDAVADQLGRRPTTSLATIARPAAAASLITTAHGS